MNFNLIQSEPVVCKKGGACFHGSWLKDSTEEFTFASFQGIRYGQAPVGDLRFKPAKDFYYDVKDVDVSQESQVVCPQYGFLQNELLGE